MRTFVPPGFIWDFMRAPKNLGTCHALKSDTLVHICDQFSEFNLGNEAESSDRKCALLCSCFGGLFGDKTGPFGSVSRST